MKNQFSIDFPNPNPSEPWIEIAVVDTKKEALEILRETYNIMPEVAEVFISEINGDEDEGDEDAPPPGHFQL